jgi:NAD(P)-dependent dehydrogenase (short-subunit alcohol dehydrogenase family)
MNLEGISALVTGGGSGLGGATVAGLVRVGAKVTAMDLNAQALEEVRQTTGCHTVEGDVADETAASKAIDAAEATHGTVRILINCAGIGNAARTVGRDGVFPLSLFDRIVRVNLIGTFNMMRLVAERLVKAEPTQTGERGVFVNTASVAAFEGQIGQAGYAASKAGVAGMTLPVARDLAQFGIRVCTIAPGLFLTPMLMGLPQEARDSLGSQVPFPSRLGEPQEYAKLALHIIDNQMLNGETIRLDGAIRMGPR